jgi:hypothetical protein
MLYLIILCYMNQIRRQYCKSRCADFSQTTSSTPSKTIVQLSMLYPNQPL